MTVPGTTTAARQRLPNDASVEVRGTRIAYRQWGAEHEPPVLALHGFLDNAASFDALGPLLRGHRLIALDLPGHGLSAHRAASGSYNIWDDLPDLVGFAERLGLRRYALLGHSRGAFIATLLAAIEAPAVSSLVLLDGILPPPFDEHDSVAQLRKFAHDYGRRVAGTARVFATPEAAIEARVAATGIDRRAAQMLMARSLESVTGGCRWRTDGRLRYASASKFGASQLTTVLQSLDLPGLLVVADSDIGRITVSSKGIAAFRGLQVERIAGCHHWHMLEAAPAIATCILAFWRGRE